MKKSPFSRTVFLFVSFLVGSERLYSQTDNWIIYPMNNPIRTVVSSILFGKDNLVYAGCGYMSYGIDVFNRASQQWSRYDTSDTPFDKFGQSLSGYTMLFDKNNTLWVASQKGLTYLANGTWNKLDSSTTAMKDNTIMWATCDKNNNIWFAYRFFASLACLKNDSVFHYDMWKQKIPSPNPNGTVMVTDSNDAIWYISMSGMVRFDGTNWTVFDSTNVPDINGLNSPITYLYVLPDGTVLAGTRNSKLLSYRNNTWESVDISNVTGAAVGEINVIRYDSAKHTLWLGGGRTSTLVRRDNLNKWSAMAIPSPSGMEFNHFLSLAVDNESKLWIGTIQDGIMVYSPQISSIDAQVTQCSVSVYHNQLSDIVYVKPCSNNKSTITIADLNGKTMQAIQHYNNTEMELSIRHLPKGIYFIGMVSENGDYVPMKHNIIYHY